MGREAEANRKRREDPAGFHAADRFGHPVTTGSELLWLSPAGFKVQIVDVRPILNPKAPPGSVLVKMVGTLQVVFESALINGRTLKMDDFVFLNDRPIYDEEISDAPQPPAAQPGQPIPGGDTPPGDPPTTGGPALITPPDGTLAPDPNRKIHLV